MSERATQLGVIVSGTLLAAYGTAKLRQGEREGGVNRGAARAAQLAGAALVGYSTFRTSSTAERVLGGGVLAALAFTELHTPREGRTLVGWSQPPRPIDVIPSFDPSASKRDQARLVLYDYFHDDELRGWADDGDVKHCFGVKDKADFDPAFLVEAYENPNHKVWQCKGGGWGKHAWSTLDHAVKGAIARRTRLGPLPKSSYDSDPVVIYYYDNDRMKKISYPRVCMPNTLNPSQLYWWKDSAVGCVGSDTSDAGKKKGLDGIHTHESQDPKAIAAERRNPGMPGGGHWGDEGFDWNKDVAGNVASIFSDIMQLVGTALQIIPGVGSAAGTIIMTLTPYLTQAVDAADKAFQGGDNAAALDNLAKMALQAAQFGLSKGAGINVPPVAMQALAGTIDGVAKAVDAGQKQKLDYGSLWNKVAAKAKSFGRIGDEEAHTLSVLLGENSAGKVFIKGHTAGKFSDPDTIAALGKIMTGYIAFTDPRIVNVFLLGAGIGYLSKAQEQAGMGAGPVKQAKMQASASTTATHGWGYPWAFDYAWYGATDGYY